MAAFLVLAVPGLLLDGFDGFVYGRIGAALVALAVRSVYMRGMLGGVRYRALLTPTLLPLALACAAALLLRVVLWGGHRSLAQALAELVLFVAVYLVTAVRRERPLLDELLGALRGRPEPLALGGDR